MSKSQETYSKKEREKKRQKKKKDKLEKKEQRKQDAKDGKITENMFMYVDENGNLTPTPPDPLKKIKVSIEDIEISVPKKGDEEEVVRERRGTVKFFNHEKGFGFIHDQDSNQSIFVHINSVEADELNEKDKVTFQIEMGMKGPTAVQVRLVV